VNPPIENVPTTSIVVGKRLRKDMGDIVGLVESIRDDGLLHPLTVDQDNMLICGERRLRALRELGFEEVPVRRWFVIDDKHRAAIELAENVHRKDLTEIEKSRDVVKAAELAREVDKAEILPDSGSKSRGRPPVPGSTNRVAELIGVPRTTIQEAEKHVAAVNTYPVFEGWKQYHAMEAAETLDKLPEEERPAFVALIDQPGIPPRDAIRTLQNVVAKAPEERQKIIALSQSDDDRDRTLALTEAAAVPPMPDPRLMNCHKAIAEFRQAIKHYPNDPEVSQFKDLIDATEAVANAIRARRNNAHSAAD